MARASAGSNGARLRGLVQRHGTPLVAISRSAIRMQLNRFRRALPRVEPFYAVKANPHPDILKVLVSGGAGFDVASLAEMTAAIEAGAGPERIIFANTIKPARSIAAIGGGFPITHFDGEEDVFEKIAKIIMREIERLFDRKVRIIAEPGRFIAGPAATLIMRVIGKAIRENKHWYYLDDGVYGDLSGIIFDHAQYEFKVLRSGRSQLSTLAGPTCDSLDIIARGQDLPELEIGDIVYVERVGAYSTATATAFNGIAPAKIVMVA
ncbi:MAG: hypothetical protein NT045_00610 [Candidatus Aureabacteria bacterium]|nr:hypothetical protein [Candidatus Auribacterota bacterium]